MRKIELNEEEIEVLQYGLNLVIDDENDQIDHTTLYNKLFL